MKTFIVQSFALIGTVFIIMEAASIPEHHPNKSELLKMITDDAKNMSEKWSTDLLQERVPSPTMAAVKCPACFFWSAEMSLKTKNFKNLALTRHLHQYNKLANTTHCDLNKNRTCTLQQLLDHVIDCAKNIV